MTGLGLAVVRRRSLTAPWWVLSLVYGGCIAIFSVLLGRFRQDHGWTESVAVGLLIGVVLGLGYGPSQHRRNARLLEAAGDPTGEQVSRVPWRWRRSVPPDPGQRALVLAMADHQERLLRRQRPWALAVLGPMLVLAAWAGVAASPWWWLFGALCLVALVWHVLMPGRLRLYADRVRAAG